MSPKGSNLAATANLGVLGRRGCGGGGGVERGGWVKKLKEMDQIDTSEDVHSHL